MLGGDEPDLLLFHAEAVQTARLRSYVVSVPCAILIGLLLGLQISENAGPYQKSMSSTTE